MKDKKEIPKYHKSGDVKYYYGKMRSANSKKVTDYLGKITEVNSLSKIDLINLKKENYEHNVNNTI
jgi:hypothetical protein